MKLRVARALPFLVVGTVSACGGGNLASNLAVSPAFAPKGQTKCGVTKSQESPLIVEWPSSDRLELETRTRQGVAVVHYVGCEMQLLPRCHVPATYNYLGGNRKVDKVVMKDADDLYANLPVGAANFEGKLQRSGQLTVAMDLVGRYEASSSTVNADDLKGECDGATHFVYGVTVGAFDFFAGADASVGGKAGIGALGGGANSEATRETLTRDGEVSACETASPDDKFPPAECGALIRIEVVPLGVPKRFEPTCPGGTKWIGSQCVGRTIIPIGPGTPKWLFFGVAGGAVAAVGVASGFALHANDLNNQQLAMNAYLRDPDVKSSIQSQSTVANVLFAGGGVLGLGAVVLAFTTHWKGEGDSTVSLAPWTAPGGGGVGARGSF